MEAYETRLINAEQDIKRLFDRMGKVEDYHHDEGNPVLVEK